MQFIIKVMSIHGYTLIKSMRKDFCTTHILLRLYIYIFEMAWFILELHYNFTNYIQIWFILKNLKKT